MELSEVGVIVQYTVKIKINFWNENDVLLFFTSYEDHLGFLKVSLCIWITTIIGG